MNKLNRQQDGEHEIMKLTKVKLATAVGLAISLGMAGQASASVYAGSRLLIQDLSIISSNTGPGGGQPPGSDISSFEFRIENTARLNNIPDPSASTGNNCGGTFAANDCGLVTALDADPANAPAGAPVRSNNDFSFFGTSANQYSNADSVIFDAELTGDPTTRTSQISESELQTGTSAGASAEVGSSTGLIFAFQTEGDTTDLVITFEADPALGVAINQLDFLNGNARAGVEFNVALTQDSSGDQVNWSPDGTATNNCGVDAGLAGVSCTELDDDEDLNRNLSVSSNGASNTFSPGAIWEDFGIEIAGLGAGNWTLALTAFTNTAMRQTQVPLPGTLLLLGAGLVAVSARRKKTLPA